MGFDLRNFLPTTHRASGGFREALSMFVANKHVSSKQTDPSDYKEGGSPGKEEKFFCGICGYLSRRAKEGASSWSDLSTKTLAVK